MIPIDDWETAVYCGDTLIEIVGPVRARELERAENATCIRRRNGHISRIYLEDHGQDFRIRAKQGNPQSESHDNETDTNPKNVWTFREHQKIA